MAAVAMIGSVLAVISPASADSASLMKDTLSREKLSVASVTHTLVLTLPAFSSATGTQVVVDYSAAGFTLDAGTVAGSTINTGTISVVSSATDVVITCTSGPCGGLFTSGSFTGANPSSNGSKTITIGGSAAVTGSFAIPIVTDDQISVTASVDPSITFNVAAQGDEAYDCDGTLSANGGTVALGTLTTAAITSSDLGLVKHICTRVSTNATSGAIVTVKSTNASLKSTSAVSDTIPSATAVMAAGTANYGLCDGARSGSTTSTPAAADPVTDSPFNSTCANDVAAGSVGALTTGAQTIWHVTGPTSNAFQNIVVKAAISGTTKAHTDYTDTLTFVATGTF